MAKMVSRYITAKIICPYCKTYSELHSLDVVIPINTKFRCPKCYKVLIEVVDETPPEAEEFTELTIEVTDEREGIKAYGEV